ncbi:15372_t:CDS:2 [Funneliformis geosporum]|nr:15372_t:CDS:2 [Funneliformis geosporum]
MSLPTRVLGKTGVNIPTIGLGCMGMSEFYGQADEKESIKVLNKSIELGSVFWDTADIYGKGDNEVLLSKVLKERRNEVFLCTKFGFVRGPNGEFMGVKGDREHVRQACEKSLKRLGIDYIDLYYQHRVDSQTPIEETVAAMADLVKEGKVKYIGLSECSIEYSPWSLDIEKNGIMEACRELGVTIVAYSPIGRGFLTGKYKSLDDFDQNDCRRIMPRFLGDNFNKNLEIVKKFQEYANKKGVSSSQLCLAWVLAQGENIVAIPGTKKIKYLEENFGAANVQLTPEELTEIRQIIDSMEFVGSRYPEQIATVTYRITIWTDMLFTTECNCWAENSKGDQVARCFRVAGYNDCSSFGPDSIRFLSTPTNDTYWVHTDVFLSLRKEKIRGPFQNDTCWKIGGNVFNWEFNTIGCCDIPNLC